MKRTLILFAAALSFWLEPLARHASPVFGALVLVALGVALAGAASGEMTAIAAGAGAFGALVHGALTGSSMILASAALFGLAYAERATRVRELPARVLHVGLALAGGAMAGALVTQYAGAALAVRGVVILVAAILTALPQLVEADDLLAHRLEQLADDLPAAAGAPLKDGAALRRTVEPGMLSRDLERQAQGTWKALEDLARARVRLESKPMRGAHGEAVMRRLDDRIEAHVRALSRIYTAVDEAKAAEMSLADGPLRSVETSGESLEELSRVMVEDV